MELVCSLTGSGVSRCPRGHLSLTYVPLALWDVLVPPSFRRPLPLSGSHTPGTFRLASAALDKLKRTLRREREGLSFFRVRTRTSPGRTDTGLP